MKKNDRKTSVGFVALGCAKNTVDLQVMAGHLLKAGFAAAARPEEADVVLVNTCAFIESAREEAVTEILRACELKKTGRCKAVVVSGCFVQRYKRDMARLFPDVDAFVGIDALDKIAGIVQSLAHGESGALLVPPGQAKKVFDPPMAALRFSGQAYAYLKIAEGCAHKCAYCAIPAIRGKYRSREMAAIVKEAAELVRTGVKELNVIAQDPMLYGIDLGMGKDGLATLLGELDKIEGEFWIRVLYSYPNEITERYLEWMKTSPHAARYVDVPLQHTDEAVLACMNRKAAAKATREAAARLRQAIPGVTLRTTVMTGHPGETQARFERLLADLEQMQFDHLGAFAFSPEEGTAAAAMKNRPSKRIAEERMAQVMALQKKIWRKKALGMKGKVFKALVTENGVARMESQAPEVDGVVFIPPDAARPGSFANIRITGVKSYDFNGELAE